MINTYVQFACVPMNVQARYVHSQYNLCKYLLFLQAVQIWLFWCIYPALVVVRCLPQRALNCLNVHKYTPVNRMYCSILGTTLTPTCREEGQSQHSACPATFLNILDKIHYLLYLGILRQIVRCIVTTINTCMKNIGQFIVVFHVYCCLSPGDTAGQISGILPCEYCQHFSAGK